MLWSRGLGSNGTENSVQGAPLEIGRYLQLLSQPVPWAGGTDDLLLKSLTRPYLFLEVIRGGEERAMLIRLVRS